MPATIDIRTRKKAYEGGPDLWNAVVYAPQELFDRQPGLVRDLIRHGFSAMPSSGGSGSGAVWTLPPAPVDPPLYLGDLFGAKHDVSMTRATRRLVETARNRVDPEDGLERLLGAGRHTAGQQALRVRAGSQFFVANCDASDKERRQYLSGAGWLPVPEQKMNDGLRQAFGTMPFLTSDPFLAANLTPLMDSKARARLRTLTDAAVIAIQASHSQEPPEGFEIPAPEGLAYLPFQIRGVHSIISSGKSGLIADDMGLGKTIQGIGVLNMMPQARDVLLTCQANMKLKWKREIEKWCVNQELSIGIAEGDFFPDTDIVIINYDIVDRHHGKIHARRWDLFLEDEAHNTKTADIKRTVALLGDVIGNDPGVPMVPLKPGGIFLPLTGTPKPNKIADLWPLLSRTRPDVWGSGPDAYRAFIHRYQPPRLMRKKMRRGTREWVTTIELAGKPIRELELQLRMRGSGSFIRRMKRDTDLPPKFRTPLELPFRFSDADRRALAEVDTDIEALAQRVAIENGMVRQGESLPAGAIIDVITGLVPSSPHFAEGARVRANLGRLKAPYMARFLAEELLADADLEVEDRRKTVVFAHHKDVIAEMARILRQDFPDGVLVYDGSVSSGKKKQALVDRFQEDPEARIFIMSKSGNSGITLTAAHRMRIAEPDWDPANMSQIEDRIWRIGQEQPCDIGYLFAPGSHDMNIGASLIQKMDVDERALNSFVVTSKTALGRDAAHQALFNAAATASAEDVEIHEAVDSDAQMRLPI